MNSAADCDSGNTDMVRHEGTLLLFILPYMTILNLFIAYWDNLICRRMHRPRMSLLNKVTMDSAVMCDSSRIGYNTVIVH